MFCRVCIDALNFDVGRDSPGPIYISTLSNHFLLKDAGPKHNKEKEEITVVPMPTANVLLKDSPLNLYCDVEKNDPCWFYGFCLVNATYVDKDVVFY